MTSDRATLENTVAILGRCACDAELLAADDSLAIEERADYHILAGKLRNVQMETLADFALANVVGERQNVSRVPRGPWVGLRNALLVVAALFGLVALAIWKGGL